jgi:DNA-directed RNA polymerase specialized sigma24 family protein
MTMTSHVDAAFRPPPPLLSAPATRRLLTRYVARRVPACDVDDVVQATLCDALASGRAPWQEGDLHRWLLAIARFKVVDAHRAAARAAEGDPGELAGPPAPIEAESLFRWAERQLPAGASATLRWMLREAEGEKLEAIAADEALPAARVRQRVSRLRRWMRERWLAELSLVAVLGVVAASALGSARRSYTAIEPEIGAPASAWDTRLAGRWRLVGYRPEAPLSAGRQALFSRVAPGLGITFDGRRLRAATADGGLDRSFTALLAAGGQLSLVETEGEQRIAVTYAWDGEDLLITAPSGPWAGVARFRAAR